MTPETPIHFKYFKAKTPTNQVNSNLVSGDIPIQNPFEIQHGDGSDACWQFKSYIDPLCWCFDW